MHVWQHFCEKSLSYMCVSLLFKAATKREELGHKTDLKWGNETVVIRGHYCHSFMPLEKL